ncbi:hypothetical protein [Ekhidna sp.]
MFYLMIQDATGADGVKGFAHRDALYGTIRTRGEELQQAII